MNYFDNLGDVMVMENDKALKYGDHQAWHNKKMKTRKRHMPRGRAFKRLWNQHRESAFRSIWNQYLNKKAYDHANIGDVKFIYNERAKS